MSAESIVPVERIERAIFLIRGHKVMLDRDLADLYDVPTKAFNQAVRRNQDRFPGDFMFRLTRSEKHQVVTDCDHLRRLKYAATLPCAFTEHGALMLSSVLRSGRAVRVSLEVVRAFVRIRRFLATHKELARRLDELERKYDGQFSVVFEAIRGLMASPDPPRRPIGFHVPGKPHSG